MLELLIKFQQGLLYLVTLSIHKNMALYMRAFKATYCAVALQAMGVNKYVRRQVNFSRNQRRVFLRHIQVKIDYKGFVSDPSKPSQAQEHFSEQIFTEFNHTCFSKCLSIINGNISMISKVLIRMPFPLCYTVSNFLKMPMKTISSAEKWS